MMTEKYIKSNLSNSSKEMLSILFSVFIYRDKKYPLSPDEILTVSSQVILLQTDAQMEQKEGTLSSKSYLNTHLHYPEGKK